MNGEGRGTHPGLHTTAASTTTSRATVARATVNAAVRRARLARWAELHMPLVTYYGPQPLRAVPLAQLLAEGRWAA